MGKKKLKALMRRALNSTLAVQSSTPELETQINHGSPLIYSIYQIKNGYNVVVYSRTYDTRGSVSSQVTTVHYVDKLTDIPTVMASTGAAHVMGMR